MILPPIVIKTVHAGSKKLVDLAAGSLTNKAAKQNQLTEKDKEPVKDLLSRSITFAIDAAFKGSVSGIEVGIYIISSRL